MTAWWTSKASAVETRILIILETSESSWVNTDDIVDHWLLFAYKNEDHIRRSLGGMRKRGWLQRRPYESNGVHQWKIVVEGLGIQEKPTER